MSFIIRCFVNAALGRGRKEVGRRLRRLGNNDEQSVPRLERLELRNAPPQGIQPILIRVLLVDPEKGLTGVLLLDGAKPTTSVPATAEEEASVSEDLARRARARQLPIFRHISRLSRTS